LAWLFFFLYLNCEVSYYHESERQHGNLAVSIDDISSSFAGFCSYLVWSFEQRFSLLTGQVIEFRMKQGQAFGLKKVIGALIPLLVLLLLLAFYYGSDGSFNKVKGLVKGIAESVTIGAEKIDAQKPVLPREHQEAITNLKRTIESVRGKENCIVKYSLHTSNKGDNGFPELGEKGTSIILKKSGGDTRLGVLGGISGKQEISRETIEGVQPCVIAGGNTAKNFYNRFVLGNTAFRSFYNPVDQVVIAHDSSVGKFNENRIFYTGSAGFADFKDGGWLFVSGNNICFFPTEDDFDGVCVGDSANGLDDSCLIESSADINAVFNKVQRCQ